MRLGTSLAVLCVATVVFSPNAQAATLKTLYSFCTTASCTDGATPVGSLLADPNGNLFGTTLYGGSAPGFQGYGTVFELSPRHGGKWTFSAIDTFCTQSFCADGASALGDLIMDTAGNLYGATAGGGSFGHGIDYELSPSGTGWHLSDLHDFADTPDGFSPNGGLRYVGFANGTLYDGTSPLYGTTFGGGPSDGGTVYKLTPGAGSWTVTILHGFANDQNGEGPVEDVTLDATGANMYGVLYEPFGGVFRLSDAGGGTWDETTLYSFSKTTGDDTYRPSSTLLLDASGSLIGIASDGGPHCKYSRHHGEKRCGGGMFKLSGGSADPAFAAIHDFCAGGKLCPDGDRPVGNLVMDASGTIYGVTAGGGTYRAGTVFRVKRESKLEVLYNFCSQPNCSDGKYPGSGLTFDAKGHLYGVTTIGGAANQGTVFEFTP